MLLSRWATNGTGHCQLQSWRYRASLQSSHVNISHRAAQIVLEKEHFALGNVEVSEYVEPPEEDPSENAPEVAKFEARVRVRHQH